MDGWMDRQSAVQSMVDPAGNADKLARKLFGNFLVKTKQDDDTTPLILIEFTVLLKRTAYPEGRLQSD